MFTGRLKHLSRSHDLRTRYLTQISTERHVFLGTAQKEPSLRANKASGGLLVTGENTNMIKTISIFMQYCDRL